MSFIVQVLARTSTWKIKEMSYIDVSAYDQFACSILCIRSIGTPCLIDIHANPSKNFANFSQSVSESDSRSIIISRDVYNTNISLLGVLRMLEICRQSCNHFSFHDWMNCFRPPFRTLKAKQNHFLRLLFTEGSLRRNLLFLRSQILRNDVILKG